ncbi:penicillin-binding protein 1A [Rhodohalobacter halophilus]|uniref:penicillin-binding protein 1A n=1 Tax=Rhodohalobacter halophilus TaxID=1812810 RepID=UPI00083F5193|nr:transglycosylase domain-containing protein [Rhodohalobacter halophilus]
MSDNEHNIDMDRYFDDPEYRKSVMGKNRQNPESERGPNPTKRNGVGKKILIYGGSTAAALLLMGIGYFIYLLQGLPSIQELENPQTAVATEVRSHDGAVLDRYFVENRTYVTIDNISPNVINALIATEDHRFFDHWGVDIRRLAGLPYYWIQGRIQGGSTISQQLARNLYRNIGFEVSVTRKLREMITAIQIENNYTKREIIEMYLNTVEFSNSAFGIEQAARTHYGKSAGDLTISEAATLIGQLRAVYAYNPRRFPERAQFRRNVVLNQMYNRNFISDEVFETLRMEEIQLNYQPPSRSGRESRYFGEYVRLQVQRWALENGYDLFTDGLVIYTTIDSRLQRHAERAVLEKLEEFQPVFEREWTSRGGDYMNEYWEEYPTYLRDFIRETDRYKNGFQKFNTDQESVVFAELMADSAFVDSVKRVNTKLQAGFTAIDPNNGNVLVWVGGADFGAKQFDHVHQSRRQAGSTFKPFVYAVAIDNGYMPYHKFSKYPSSFIETSGRLWNPKDPSVPSGPEMVSLREALARSLNNVTVRLLPEIAGAPGTNRANDLMPAATKIAEMASNLGINMTNQSIYPSIALGTTEVSLLELVSAYTTFVNQGVHIEPVAITRIEDREGNVLEEFNPKYTQEVISPETAYMMIDMMRGVIRGGADYHGTGVRLRNVYGVQQDVAGKTGTTQNSADNWFVAMMPHIVMGAWVGGEDRKIRFPTNDPNSIGQGARTALPIVGEFINRVTNDPEAPWSYDAFEQPPGFVMPEDPANQERNDRRGRIGW